MRPTRRRPGADSVASRRDSDPGRIAFRAMTTLTRARLHSQLLSGDRATRPVDVAARLLAIQGQDPRGARLAIRVRSTGLTAADVDRTLTVERSLVITWLNRGTLHLVRSEDYPWLHALTAGRQATWNSRRLGQLGVSPDEADRAIATIERALEADGPSTRDQLRERIAATGVTTDAQAWVHILSRASIRGLIVRGPMIGRDHAFVLVRDWLGSAAANATAAFDRDRALAELARRYLAGHGPATDVDLAAWAGLPLGEARRGLRAIGGEIEESDGGLLDLSGRAAVPELPPPMLLGPFDPLLHGWKSREFVVGDHAGVITSNGIFRPFALVHGHVVATWRFAGGRVSIDRLESIPPESEKALEAEARAVARYFGRS